MALVKKYGVREDNLRGVYSCSPHFLAVGVENVLGIFKVSKLQAKLEVRLDEHLQEAGAIIECVSFCSGCFFVGTRGGSLLVISAEDGRVLGTFLFESAALLKMQITEKQLWMLYEASIVVLVPVESVIAGQEGLPSHRKWRLRGQSLTRDFAVILSPTKELFQSELSPLPSTFFGRSRGDDDEETGSGALIVMLGENPSAAAVYVGQSGLTFHLGDLASAVASKLTLAVSSTLKSWTNSWWGGHGGGEEGTAAVQEAVPATMRSFDVSLNDPVRVFLTAKPDPTGRLVACTDSLGRVVLMDARPGLLQLGAIRIWKGYRDAECGWIVSSVSAETRGVHLVLFAPRRACVEIWRMRFGPRVAVIRFEGSPSRKRLLYVPPQMLVDNAGQASLSHPRCLLLDGESDKHVIVNEVTLGSDAESSLSQYRMSSLNQREARVVYEVKQLALSLSKAPKEPEKRASLLLAGIAELTEVTSLEEVLGLVWSSPIGYSLPGYVHHEILTLAHGQLSRQTSVRPSSVAESQRLVLLQELMEKLQRMLRLWHAYTQLMLEEDMDSNLSWGALTGEGTAASPVTVSDEAGLEEECAPGTLGATALGVEVLKWAKLLRIAVGEDLAGTTANHAKVPHFLLFASCFVQDPAGIALAEEVLPLSVCRFFFERLPVDVFSMQRQRACLKTLELPIDALAPSFVCWLSSDTVSLQGLLNQRVDSKSFVAVQQWLEAAILAAPPQKQADQAVPPVEPIFAPLAQWIVDPADLCKKLLIAALVRSIQGTSAYWAAVCTRLRQVLTLKIILRYPSPLGCFDSVSLRPAMRVLATMQLQWEVSPGFALEPAADLPSVLEASREEAAVLKVVAEDACGQPGGLAAVHAMLAVILSRREPTASTGDSKNPLGGLEALTEADRLSIQSVSIVFHSFPTCSDSTELAVWRAVEGIRMWAHSLEESVPAISGMGVLEHIQTISSPGLVSATALLFWEVLRLPLAAVVHFLSSAMLLRPSTATATDRETSDRQTAFLVSVPAKIKAAVVETWPLSRSHKLLPVALSLIGLLAPRPLESGVPPPSVSVPSVAEEETFVTWAGGTEDRISRSVQPFELVDDEIVASLARLAVGEHRVAQEPLSAHTALLSVSHTLLSLLVEFSETAKPLLSCEQEIQDSFPRVHRHLWRFFEGAGPDKGVPLFLGPIGLTTDSSVTVAASDACKEQRFQFVLPFLDISPAVAFSVASNLCIPLDELRREYILRLYQKDDDAAAEELLVQVENKQLLGLSLMSIARRRLALVLLGMRNSKRYASLLSTVDAGTSRWVGKCLAEDDTVPASQTPSLTATHSMLLHLLRLFSSSVRPFVVFDDFFAQSKEFQLILDMSDLAGGLLRILKTQ